MPHAAGKKLANGLWLRHDRFIEEYLVDFNGARAARAVGYPHTNSQEQAVSLLKREDVQRELALRCRKLTEDAGIRVERVIEELSRIAFADIATYITWDNEQVVIKETGELPDGASRAVAEIEANTTQEAHGEGAPVTVHRRVKVKMLDKLQALKMLGQYLKMFVDRVEVTHDLKISDLTRKSDAELEAILIEAEAIKEG